MIEDMYAELRAILYMLFKGFTNIEYQRRNGLDFLAEFDGNIYNIEATYLRGPDFKTQEIIAANEKTKQPFYSLKDTKLISRLKSIYKDKEKQLKAHAATSANSIIIIVSDLLELFEPWLKHEKYEGQPALKKFISSRDIPTVIFHSGSVYEPDSDSLEGIFGKLTVFNWNEFKKKF